MKTKNKYIGRSRISEAKFRKIIKYFSLDIEANKASVLSSLNRNTLNRYYMLIRRRIAEYCETEGSYLGHFNNADLLNSSQIRSQAEWYFLSDISMVFGICVKGGRIYAEIIRENELPDDKNMLASRQGIECFFNSYDRPRWKEYKAIVDYGSGRYVRTISDAGDFEQVHDLKSCDLFWGYAKNRLMKFNGISKATLYLHIKECEFRFNCRNQNLYKMLLKIIREHPLN